MKIELEGREALQHTNAVHTLHSLGYQFVGAEWVAPQEESQEEDGTVFIGEALISTGGITKAEVGNTSREESLRKGHATLTKRVQELETELKAQKEKGFTLITPRGMEVYDARGTLRVVTGTVEKKTASAADTQLQADIEALTARVSDLEFAAQPGYFDFSKLTEGQKARAVAFNQAVDQQITNAMYPGGVLHGRIK